MPLRHGTPRDSFYPDPPHRFRKVQSQIFGRGPNAPPDMSGFAQAFVDENPLLPMRAEHRRDATPEAITEYYAELVGG